LSNTKKRTSFSEKFKNMLRQSVFIHFFVWLAEFFHNKIKFSKTMKLLSSFFSLEKSYNESYLKKKLSVLWFKPDKWMNIKNSLQKAFGQSFFYTLYLKLVNSLLALRARVYGVILFIYGFCALSVGLIKTFVSTSVSSDYSLIYQGGVLILTAIILLFSKTDLGTLLSRGRITGYFIREIVGLKNENVIREPIDENMVVPMLVGIVLGVSSMFVQPIFVLIACLGFIYVSLVFTRPEFGVLVIALSVAFLPTMVICAQVILTFAAFLCKVIRGKRSVSFGPVDLVITIFAVFLFLGGVFSSSVATSLPAVCVFLCFMLAYYLIVNLVKSMQLLKKILFVFAFSFLCCSLLGIWQNFFGIPDTKWTDVDMFSEIETRVISTFDNPNVFGEYLIIMFPTVFAMFLTSYGFKKRSFLSLGLVSGIMALVFTWSRGAWIGFVVSMIIYFIIVNKKSIAVYIVGLVSLPFAYPFLPESIKTRIESIGNTADTSTSYRVHIWEGSWNMLKDWWSTGIGVGTGAFGEVYPVYSLTGIERAPHAHNLFFQVFVELGVFGILALLVLVLFVAIKCCTYLAKGTQKDIKLISTGALLGLFAILVQGLTDYVWYNYRIFLLFWMVLAISCVAVNVASREEGRLDNKDNIYGGKNEKAEIDIQI